MGFQIYFRAGAVWQMFNLLNRQSRPAIGRLQAHIIRPINNKNEAQMLIEIAHRAGYQCRQGDLVQV
jgi:hypothetical protein